MGSVLCVNSNQRESNKRNVTLVACDNGKTPSLVSLLISKSLDGY